MCKQIMWSLCFQMFLKTLFTFICHSKITKIWPNQYFFSNSKLKCFCEQISQSS
jgi:hypothetical protein